LLIENFEETPDVARRTLFSSKIEQRRRYHVLAVSVAATLFVAGIGLIAFSALRGFDMLAATDADSTPIMLGMLVAFGGLVVLCLIAYAAIRAYGRVAVG
jgi:hypothetical protein